MKPGSGRTIAVLMLLTSACSRSPAEDTVQNETPALAEAPKPAVESARTEEAPEAPAVVAKIATTPVPDLPQDETIANSTQDAMPFPDEVTDFMVARDGCDHFRGEEPYDEERRVFLEDNIRTLCTGSDVKLADLRKRYRKDAEVMSALHEYADKIETPPSPE